MGNDKRVVQRLRILAKFDVDAVGAYQAAIERVTEPAIKEKLNGFRLDHARHVQDYNAVISQLGGETVEMTPEPAGIVLKGVTAATSMLGTRAALLAMLANEQLSNATYEVMLRMSWPPEVKALIEHNRADEKRHLEWILMAAKSPEQAEREATEQQA
jgi:rubrerythrin